MTGLIAKVQTAIALGPLNIARVVAYRALLRLRLHPVMLVKAPLVREPYFRNIDQPMDAPSERSGWRTEAFAFGWSRFAVGAAPPNWFASPIDGRQFPGVERPWWQIGDFSDALDIKTVWELSRFDWVIAFAQHARASDGGAIERLNGWLADWVAKNAPYHGPNWKCGQEASLRVLHVAAAALILRQVDRPEPGLIALVRAHLQRIAPSLGYALAQDNNHGTSEAAALFVGGSWLAKTGDRGALKWAAMGRRWLEERVERLIGDQGSFSQYSVNYHRLVLDTLSFVEMWRHQIAAEPFSNDFYKRSRLATEWLFALTDPVSGDAPNIGANDGARLFVLDDGPFRDYRISTQRAAAVFLDRHAFPLAKAANQSLQWLGIAEPALPMAEARSLVADDGGFAVLRNERAMAMLRYPQFRFRPSQADALHLDLWIDGINVLCDAGTYSYRSTSDDLSQYGSVVSHNTIAFDDHDQMPQISRFLYAHWLKTNGLPALAVSGTNVSLTRSYRDHWGATHSRSITLEANGIEVRDEIAGFEDRAVLRWRFPAGKVALTETAPASRGEISLHMQAAAPFHRLETTTGWESRHYLERTPLSVIDAEVRTPTTIISKFRWY